MQDNILEVRNLCKSYGGVKALDNVTLTFRRGEVHALAGENGAGKSTLIKAITGAITPDSGSIRVEAKRYTKLTPMEALGEGISAIYQEFTLIPQLTVAENVFFGKEIGKNGFVNKNAMNAAVKQLLEEMGIELDPNDKVCNLGVAYQQLVEIVKAVAADSKILIMDEPTAPLTTRETEMLFGIIQRLRKRKVTIIYISHRMEEILSLCDRVTVLRDGKFICTENTADIDVHRLIAHMVGRELSDGYPPRQKPLGEVIMRADKLETAKIHGVSFELHRGEILGFGGLVGAGRSETMQALFGADRVTGGSIEIKGKKLLLNSPAQALKNGIALIPEDRKNQGAFLGQSIRRNISFSSLKRIMKGLFVSTKKDVSLAQEYVDKLKIKTSGTEQPVKNLSGGNQQKVVLAKAIATGCDIILFDEPTRGIDVGAKQEIYNLMRYLADEEGKSIIMVSSEMAELIGMSDRILVMRRGTIAGEIQRKDFSQELILEYACGQKQGDNEHV